MAFDERALAKCALALCSRVWRLASYCLAPRLACRAICTLPVRPHFGFIPSCADFRLLCGLRFAYVPGFWLHTALRRVWLVVRLADAVCHASQGLLSVSCFSAASHNCLHCVQSFPAMSRSYRVVRISPCRTAHAPASCSQYPGCHRSRFCRAARLLRNYSATRGSRHAFNAKERRAPPAVLQLPPVWDQSATSI